MITDEDWAPPPPAAGPVSTTLIRRSIKGPDERWPTPGGGYRWYTYIEDRPVGYLEAARPRRGGPVRWVPFTMTGGRLSGSSQLNDALDVLLIFDVSGRSPMRVCPVCGRARRRDDPYRPFDFGWSDDHGERCAPIAALFA
jgi:hypothetical protein